jgi:hypothetical protein
MRALSLFLASVYGPKAAQHDGAIRAALEKLGQPIARGWGLAMPLVELTMASTGPNYIS